MTFKAGFASIISLLCSASIAQAAAPDFVWSNTDGFVSAANCQVGPVKNNPFFISEGKTASALDYIDLQNSNGNRQSYLLNRSLIRLKDGKTRSGYKFVDVIGVSETPKAQVNKWFATRMDTGYVGEPAVKDLANYVIEIKSGVAVKEIPAAKVPTVGSFWQLETENGETMGFRCNVKGKSVEYFMFNVFVANQAEAVAHIGVSAEDTGIFKSILTHLPAEADKVLDSRMKDAPNEYRQSLESTSGSGSVAAKVTSPIEVAKSAGEAIKAQNEATEKNTNKVIESSITAPPVVSQSQQGSAVSAAQANVDASPMQDDGGSEEEDEEDSTLNEIKSRQEYVVCINEDTLAVRDESLNNVLFRAEKSETVLPFQSWDTADKKVKNINGKDYTFIKVQFPEKEGQNVGWLAQDYVRLEGQCSVTKKPEEEKGGMTPMTPKGPVTSIDSPACCEFPTIGRPKQSYLEGMRRFKAGRGRGKRLHAACDLYRVHGEQAVSLTEGKVVRGLYSFYQGTYAIDIQYPGGFIARYGELTGKAVKSASTGSKVTRGQIVGYIGTVNSGCCAPMLHFEIYSGKAKGPLSTKGGTKFRRRVDLVDPTKYLLKWEKMKFGTSY